MSCGLSVIPVECLQRGECGTIVDISGDDRTVHRLNEMGICCGCKITLKRNDSPILVNIDGRDLLLRCGQAAMILVSVGSTTQLI